MTVHHDPLEQAFRPAEARRERRALAKARAGFSNFEIGLAIAGFIAWFWSAYVIFSAAFH